MARHAINVLTLFILALSCSAQAAIKIIQLNNTQANTLESTITPLLGSNVQATFHNNTIVLRGAPKTLEALEKAIRRFDVSREQYIVELYLRVTPAQAQQLIATNNNAKTNHLFGTRNKQSQQYRIHVLEGIPGQFFRIRQQERVGRISDYHSTRRRTPPVTLETRQYPSGLQVTIRPDANNHVQLSIQYQQEDTKYQQNSLVYTSQQTSTLIIPIGHWVLLSGQLPDQSNDRIIELATKRPNVQPLNLIRVTRFQSNQSSHQ